MYKKQVSLTFFNFNLTDTVDSVSDQHTVLYFEYSKNNSNLCCSDTAVRDITLITEHDGPKDLSA